VLKIIKKIRPSLHAKARAQGSSALTWASIKFKPWLLFAISQAGQGGGLEQPTARTKALAANQSYPSVFGTVAFGAILRVRDHHVSLFITASQNER
jgi:hypothetical protein